MTFPFTENQNVDGRLRVFSSEVDNEELIWHRDDEDRIVQIIEADGWYFQRDDELPIELKSGDVINVSRCQWHRIIKKKNTQLIVLIKTNPDV